MKVRTSKANTCTLSTTPPIEDEASLSHDQLSALLSKYHGNRATHLEIDPEATSITNTRTLGSKAKPVAQRRVLRDLSTAFENIAM